MKDKENRSTYLYVPEHGLNSPGGSGSRSNGGRGKPAMSSTQKLPPNSLTAWPEVESCWAWSAPMSSGELCRSCKRSVPCKAAPRTAASSFWLSVDRASSPARTPSGPEQRLDEMVASMLPTEPKNSGKRWTWELNTGAAVYYLFSLRNVKTLKNNF